MKFSSLRFQLLQPIFVNFLLPLNVFQGDKWQAYFFQHSTSLVCPQKSVCRWSTSTRIEVFSAHCFL